jgi:hypothetical protein
MDESNALALDPRIEQLIQLAHAQNQSLKHLQQRVHQQAQTLASTSTRANAPTVSAPSTWIHISDLPEYSGTRHSVDTEQFLVDLTDLFRLYGTPDSDKGTYAV